MAATCFQHAYVTNDFDRAIDTLRKMYAIGPFKEMRRHSFPTGPNTKAVAHIALAFKSDLQFEIIQPLAEDVAIYTAFLPDAAFALRFHHLGQFFATPDDYRDSLERARASCPVAMDFSGYGGHYAYVDARNDVGHYLEFLYFPDGSALFDIPRY